MFFDLSVICWFFMCASLLQKPKKTGHLLLTEGCIWCLCIPRFVSFLLQILLGISWTHFTATISRYRYTTVSVGKMITCCCCFYSQSQFVFSWIQIIYCALTTSTPDVLIFTSHVVSYCKVYASKTNLIKYYPIVVVSVLFMAPYLPDWTNEAILSLILSSTTWKISSKASLVVALCEDVMIYQLSNDPSNGQ